VTVLKVGSVHAISWLPSVSELGTGRCMAFSSFWRPSNKAKANPSSSTMKAQGGGRWLWKSTMGHLSKDDQAVPVVGELGKE